jgi:uncharacterized membrane protein
MTASWIVAAVLTVALIWLVATAFRTPPESAETILRRRYATGEIDTEEFERRLNELQKIRNAA